MDGPGTAEARGDGAEAAAGLAAEVVAALRARGLTVATAESLTGGLVGAALTSVSGASAVYRGGIVAYATDLKHTLLGVGVADLARDGAVAAATAVAMADGVRSRTGADVGLATTGVAGPAPQEGHPPGTVHIALADGAGGTTRQLLLGGDREQIRGSTVEAVLRLALDRLTSTGG